MIIMLSEIIHFMSFPLKIAGGGGWGQPEVNVSTSNRKQQTSTINVQFLTIKPNVSCWEWVGMEKNLLQSELD